MKDSNILIVEGNLKEENHNFLKAGIKTHTESLKDSLSCINGNLSFDVANPSSDKNLEECLNMGDQWWQEFGSQTLDFLITN